MSFLLYLAGNSSYSVEAGGEDLAETGVTDVAERNFPKIRIYRRRRDRRTNTQYWQYLGSTREALSLEGALTMATDFFEGYPRDQLRAEFAEHFGYYIED